MGEIARWLVNFFKGFRCWVVVMSQERAVRARLGRWLKLLEPGPHLRIPLLDEVKTINSRLRITSFPMVTVTTKDGKTVTAAGLVAFHIVDPLKTIMSLKEPESTCASLAMLAVSDYIVERRFDEIIIGMLQIETRRTVEQNAPGCKVNWIRLTDFASVRTFRLLQEQWRPSTEYESN